jgi:hypothetical protein
MILLGYFYVAFDIGFILTPRGYWPQPGTCKGITSVSLRGPTNGPVVEGVRVGVRKVEASMADCLGSEAVVTVYR